MKPSNGQDATHLLSSRLAERILLYDDWQLHAAPQMILLICYIFFNQGLPRDRAFQQSATIKSQLHAFVLYPSPKN